jgi:hypothetical protein
LEKWNPLIIVKHARFVTCSMLAKIMQKKIKYNLFFLFVLLILFYVFSYMQDTKMCVFFYMKVV